MTSASSRLPELDILRVIAAASVIAIHTTSRYVTVLSAGFAWNQLVRYAVPLFVIMSGFLLENSELGKTDRPTTSGWNRTKRLLPPYIIWTFIYTALDASENPAGFAALVHQSPGGLAGMLAKNLLMGSGAVHLYFVVIIVQLYLVFPLLHSWMEKRPLATLIASFAVSFYFQLGEYMYAFGMSLVPKAGLPYYWILLIDWVFYFALGMYVRRGLDSIKPKLRQNVLWLGVFWVLSFAILYVETTRTYIASLKPTVMLYSVTSFLFFYAVCVRAERWVAKAAPAARWLAEQSFGIYLSHIFILRLLDATGLTPAPHGGREGILGMLFLFAEVCVVSVAFCRIISLTPLATPLGASPARRLFAHR